MISPGQYSDITTVLVEKTDEYRSSNGFADDVNDKLKHLIQHGYTIIDIQYSRAHYLQTYSGSIGETHAIYSALITAGKAVNDRPKILH